MFTINDSSVAVNFVSLTKKEQDQLVSSYRGKNSKESSAAKEIILSRFEPLVKFVVSSYITPKYSEQGLVKAGNKGLLKSLETYDTSKNFRLSAYASWFIRAEIHKLIGLPVDPENSNLQS